MGKTKATNALLRWVSELCAGAAPQSVGHSGKHVTLEKAFEPQENAEIAKTYLACSHRTPLVSFTSTPSDDAGSRSEQAARCTAVLSGQAAAVVFFVTAESGMRISTMEALERVRNWIAMLALRGL